MADGQMGLGGFGNQLALMDPAVAAAMRRQAYAAQLLGQASDVSPLRSPWQAATRAVSGILGGYESNVAQGQLQDYSTASRQALSDLYRGAPLPAPPGGTTAAAAPAPTTPVSPSAPGPTSTQALAPPSLTPTYQTAASSSGIPSGVLIAKDAAESTFNNNATAPLDASGKPTSTAAGIPQILASTADAPGYGLQPLGAANRTNPDQAIPFAANYLAARGKGIYGDSWDPTNPQQLRTALMAYRGNTPDAGTYADNILANAGFAKTTATGDGAATFAPTTTGGTPAAADPAAAYGIQMAQQYRTMAANAAASPYAAVRAMAPQFMQTAMGALQYGRFQIAGRDPATGQSLVIDRFGEHPPTYIGTSPRLTETPQGWITPTGTVVAPSLLAQLRSDADAIRNGTASPAVISRYNGNFQQAYPTTWKDDPTTGAPRAFPSPNVPADLPVPPQGGFAADYRTQVPPQPAPAQGGAQPWQPNIQLAQQSGVPVIPGGNPYQGQTPVEQQKNAAAARVAGTVALKDSDAQAQAAAGQIADLQRFKQVAQDVPTGPDWANTQARWLATQVGGANSDKLQQLRQLSAVMVPTMRAGTGITRVAVRDVNLFQQMVPGEQNSPAVNAQIADAAIAKVKQGLEYNRFQHAYLEANSSLAGSESAWDRYLEANPLLATDKSGNFTVNPNRQTFSDYFRANTDQKTGLLTAPGSGGGQPPMPEGKVLVQDGQRYIVRNGQAVPL